MNTWKNVHPLKNARLGNGLPRGRNYDFSTSYWKAVYVGPYAKIRGLTALVSLPQDGVVYAQFDDHGLYHRKRALWLDWHRFPAHHFRIL